MQEIISQRTVRSKTFDNGDGSLTTKLHIKPIHYVDDADELQDVVLQMEDKGTYWEMLKNNYTLRVAKDFGAPWLIQYKNQIKNWKTGTRANHSIKYEPKMLAWVNKPDLSDMQVFRNQRSVTGIYDSKTGVVRYTNAFGNGIHFEITLKRLGFTKEIVIDAKKNLELPPTAQHKLVAFFKYDGVRNGNLAHLRVRDNGNKTEWNEDTYKESANGYEIGEDDAHRSLIRPAYITDSSDLDTGKQSIKVFWKRHNGFLWQAKVLPKTFLKNAVYPVRADTYTIVYPDADTETDTVDGGIDSGWTSVWSTCRDKENAQDATFADDNDYRLTGGKQGYIGVRRNTSLKYHIMRGLLVFKYNIPSGATITAAELELTCQSDQGSSFTGVDDYLHLCKGSNAASKTSVAYTDYGNDHFSYTDIATDFDFDQQVVDDPFTFTFNSTGLAQITADGTDKYATYYLVAGYDENDVDPGYATSDNLGVGIYSADQTGDVIPALTITYTTAGGATFTPKVIIF